MADPTRPDPGQKNFKPDPSPLIIISFCSILIYLYHKIVGYQLMGEASITLCINAICIFYYISIIFITSILISKGMGMRDQVWTCVEMSLTLVWKKLNIIVKSIVKAKIKNRTWIEHIECNEENNNKNINVYCLLQVYQMLLL